MTYCLGIQIDQYLVFASDSRTNAGVDYVSTFNKMHVFSGPGDRLFVLLTAGNLAISQAVVNGIERDCNDPEAAVSLNTVHYLFDAAHYIGGLSRKIQDEYEPALKEANINAEASFILGGQIGERPPKIYLIYPQGNYITATEDTPYLQIGETKYGKPILDRIIRRDMTLGDAMRCALVSLDSTMRSNVSVGPPLHLVAYEADSFRLSHDMTFDSTSSLYLDVQHNWNEGLKNAFDGLPRFDWE